MLVKKSNLNWVKSAFVVGAACASMSASMNVSADHATVWSDRAGDTVNSRADCLHTKLWKKDSTCSGQPSNTHKHGDKTHTHDGGSATHSHNTPAPVVAPVAAPVAVPIAAPVAKAPKFEPFSLSSAAAFATSGSSLSAAGKAEINGFAKKLEGHKVESIVVEGYTDSSGAAAFNQALSEKRANAVKAEMISNGIDGNLIQTVGHGESNPVASNMTRAGRAQNRRVTVTVKGMQQVQVQ
jgi:OOP family OmpA-OmpF porin